jgi:hypothetical protein
MMNSSDKRRHERIRHVARLRVLTPPGEPLELTMRDFSESGLFVCCKKNTLIKIGDIVEVNTLEFEGAPVQKARVVRIEAGVGFAVEFVDV